LLEIETDKVNMEIEAMNSGILLKILAHEGEEVPVVQTIGYIGEKGETIPKEEAKPAGDGVVEIKDEPAHATSALKSNENRVPATPAAKRLAKEKGFDIKSVTPAGSRGQSNAADVEGATAELKATPLAKAIAEDIGVDLSNVHGTGFAGKVTRADVLEAGKQAITEDAELIPFTAMRSVIAKRMLQSHQQIPPVTQDSVADVTELMELRTKINAGGVHVSVNDFIIMAVAKVLREHPYINASYTDKGLLIKKHINIGVAVAPPEGLSVPVIKDADKLSLNQISLLAKELAGKAKEGKLLPDEYSGGTFTISNLGMMGVTSFTPIVNQPEIAILGVCATRQALEMDDDGNIRKKLKMVLSLTYDHRCIDGAQAALFSGHIVKLLETPGLMLV
jgi:pyruvate dehydrogenase E2 component (dihydrolipoamide acetyltransferase)